MMRDTCPLLLRLVECDLAQAKRLFLNVNPDALVALAIGVHDKGARCRLAIADRPDPVRVSNPPEFNVRPADALIRGYGLVGGVPFITGNRNLASLLRRAHVLHALRDRLGDLVSQRDKEMRPISDLTLFGENERSVALLRDGWKDLSAGDGSASVRVIGCDAKRGLVYAFRSFRGTSKEDEFVSARPDPNAPALRWKVLYRAELGRRFRDASRFLVREDGEIQFQALYEAGGSGFFLIPSSGKVTVCNTGRTGLMVTGPYIVRRDAGFSVAGMLRPVLSMKGWSAELVPMHLVGADLRKYAYGFLNEEEATQSPLC